MQSGNFLHIGKNRTFLLFVWNARVASSPCAGDEGGNTGGAEVGYLRVVAVGLVRFSREFRHPLVPPRWAGAVRRSDQLRARS